LDETAGRWAAKAMPQASSSATAMYRFDPIRRSVRPNNFIQTSGRLGTTTSAQEQK
jgi:hypothetical protein